ncbi:sulfatase family protein [Maribellus maritimus]|uniref:sulfatase family protein n=1 Tax=Maribellus maritimus TaxID=2870838 RepID=UPI001EE9E178|nr:sulfatase [Maribellus maritimus]MCG6187345.1 sulfatase [Maribellus maritimus]
MSHKIIFSILSLIFLVRVSVAKEISSQKPNIIIILADDLGYGDLKCYGNKNNITPNIDQMAEDGIRFTDFYMASSVCTPSRAALLTGCYPERIGLNNVLFPNSMPLGQKNGMAIGLNPTEITIAELLKSKDYKTACIGKWHLGDIPEFMPLNQGFDEYFGLPYSNDMIPGNTRYEFEPIPLYDGTKVIETNPDQDYLTMRYTEKAKEFIKRNKNNSFFLYLAHNMPHRPCHASYKYAQKWFSNEKLSEINGEGKETRDFLYPATIEELDWSVGEILITLKEFNIDSNTLIIFTSDNGPAVGSAGPLKGGKGSIYEGGLRVPCIMQWNNMIPKGTLCQELTSCIDIFPTLAYIAESNVPDDRDIDGINIIDYFLGGKKNNLRNTFFYLKQGHGIQAIRYKSWKLFIGENLQLYNLRNDIGEKNNLVGEYPELEKYLTEQIYKFNKKLSENNRTLGQIPIKEEGNN